MKSSPGILAKRAVHQYRRRDILGYASLRLYLRNQAALRDRWARNIATDLVLSRRSPIYNHIHFFKQLNEAGSPEFRNLYIPGPNEMVAETALLAECAERSDVFQPPPEVYSYRLSTGAQTNGTFQHYFYGYHDRHQSIARACRQEPDSFVLFADIEKFYPSVSLSLAEKVWSSACDRSNLSERYRSYGNKVLNNFGETDGGRNGLLIGPMFSHLIGNLVLRDIDSSLAECVSNRYYRYVDDFVFVLSKEKVDGLKENLRDQLNDIGLVLNEDKTEVVPTANFLKYAHHFEDDNSSVSWKSFIGQLKLLMLLQPERRNEMERRFLNSGIRIRPLDYSNVKQDWSYLNRIKSLSQYFWYKRRIHKLSPDRIIREGIQLRNSYMDKLHATHSRLSKGDVDPFGRKMMLSRLRLLLGRLGYLAAPDSLRSIAGMVRDVEEVAIFGSIFQALADRDVSELVNYGPVAAQSVAQPLKMETDPVRCSFQERTAVQFQAYSILLLNGVPMENQSENFENSMLTFCRGGNEVAGLFGDPNEYFRELACLHGFDQPDLLRTCLETAFDPDEEMASDIVDLLNPIYYDQYWT